MRMTYWIQTLAGLMGAAGVALAARAAHGGNDTSLMSAAMFLLVHAAALIGLVRHTDSWRSVTMWGAIVLGVGTVLFSGDLALRGLASAKLFTNAAPAGGMLMIAGWLLAAIGALLSALRGK